MRKISFNDFAVMSVQYVQYSLDYCLSSLQQAGIKHLDFWGGAPHYSRIHYPSAPDAHKKIKEIHQKIVAYGLDVVMYTPETLSYPFSYSSPDKTYRENTIRYMEHAMEDALLLGTQNVFINTGCGLRDCPREESWKWAVESISILCEKAKKMGITLVIEQLQPYESNLLIRLSDMKRILNEINSPALKVCIDVVAMEVMQETMEEHFNAYANDIHLIHFCDGNPSGHLILGDGNLPLKHYIDVLEHHNFNGYLSLEINDSIYWNDPHRSITESVNYLHQKLNI